MIPARNVVWMKDTVFGKKDAVYVLSCKSIEGELKNISRQFAQCSFTMNGNHISCVPGLIILNDRVKKLSIDSLEMYIKSLNEYEDRTIMEDIQLDVLSKLHNVMMFAELTA